VVFVLFEPRAFGGVEHLLHEAEALTTAVRGCPPIDPAKPITLPGDPERRCKAERTRTGIPIPAGTWAILERTAKELEVELPMIG